MSSRDVIRRVHLRAGRRGVGQRDAGKKCTSVRVSVNKRARRARQTSRPSARVAARPELSRAREMDCRGACARLERASATRGRVGTVGALLRARSHARRTADDSGAGRWSSGRRVTHLCVARKAQPRGVRATKYQRFRRRAVVADPAHVGVRPSRARALSGVRVPVAGFGESALFRLSRGALANRFARDSVTNSQSRKKQIVSIRSGENFHVDFGVGNETKLDRTGVERVEHR